MKKKRKSREIYQFLEEIISWNLGRSVYTNTPEEQVKLLSKRYEEDVLYLLGLLDNENR